MVKHLLPFQKGLLMCIRSLKGLFEDLQSSYGLHYLLTSRLTQDCLENFFSVVRGMGRQYNHPLPTDVTRRIRWLILGAGGIKVSRNTNCQEDDDTAFTSILKDTGHLEETAALHSEETVAAVLDRKEDNQEEIAVLFSQSSSIELTKDSGELFLIDRVFIVTI